MIFGIIEAVGKAYNALEEFSTVARDNTQSNKIYLDGNTIFIQEKLFNFCLKKIMPSDIYAQISSIKITDKDIRIIHRELGLLIAVPQTIEFGKDYSQLHYNLTYQHKIDSRNTGLLLAFTGALVGAICVSLTAGLFGFSIIGASAGFATGKYLSTKEFIGTNKTYYFASISDLVKVENLSETAFVQSFIDTPLDLSCDEKYILLELPDQTRIYLDLINTKIQDFIGQSFAEGSDFFSPAEMLGYTMSQRTKDIDDKSFDK